MYELLITFICRLLQQKRRIGESQILNRYYFSINLFSGMENTGMNPAKNGDEEKENAVLYAIESLESNGETIMSKKCRKNREPRRTLILRCRELFLHNIYGSYNSIPKHLTTCDEKYVLRCLEMIHNCALRAASWKFSQNVDFLSNDISSFANIKNRSSFIMGIDYPLGGQTEIIVNSSGTISDSPIMINILKSPVLRQFGPLDGNINFGRTGIFVAGGPFFYSDFAGSVQESNNALSRTLRQHVKVVDSKHVSSPLHKREASISSSNSSFPDQSSPSNGTPFQGMLKCTWKNGLPRHVYTLDDKKEVYVADLSEADSSTDKNLDYVYTFRLRKKGKRDGDITEFELETVAKMRVSTSITFSSDNSEVRETRFVLSDDRTVEVRCSNRADRKSRRLTRKVTNVLGPGLFRKQKSSSTLEGSSSLSQDSTLEPSEDVHNDFLDLDENKYGPNQELVAIIVKDVSNNSKEDGIGGWGLKFLKRSGNNAYVGPVTPSEHSRSTGECSTSMDVVIPAGLHGGPRTGPSSLIERWISGGLCDCGGWDMGCPLTILKTQSRSSGKDSGECRSIDLYMQGSKQNGPIMKMANIHTGLYYIHFQSGLSSLQSFAIAAAVIHSHGPVFRSKVYRK